MTGKERELVKQLLDKTRSKAISWEPTAEGNEFVVAFKGNVTFTVSRLRDEDRYGSFRLVMRNPENRELLTIDASGRPSLGEEAGAAADLVALYNEAHDSALKVEETLDAVLADLKRRAS